MCVKDMEGKATELANPSTKNKNTWLSGISANSFIKNICWLAVTATLCEKIYSSQISFTIDFPTLLSLFLAFFSVFISAQFFFKATDTSNIFYDNTYKFTQNITELLVKMESGFGERLKHIDDNYVLLRQEYVSRYEKQVMKDKEDKIETDIDEKLKEKEIFIEELVRKINTSEEEKQSYIKQYKEKEQILDKLHDEMMSLRRHNQFLSRTYRDNEAQRALPRNHPVDMYTVRHIIPRLNINDSMPSGILVRRFDSNVVTEHDEYIKDIEALGFYEDGKLTPSGVRWLRELMRENK